jgi:hypothetical protein
MDNFPDEVKERLQWYVYRLIDPRNGETFYVGKGQGNRIFHHAKGQLSATDEDSATDLKRQRIKIIRDAGLEVAHVIHRHGIKDPDIAYQIEAAVIDAYPGLSNKVGGHGSDEYGVRHVDEIIAEFKAEPFEAKEPLLLISISQSYNEPARGSTYHAVRGCWKLSEKRVQTVNLVLAHLHGRVIGAFRPKVWKKATPDNFPWLSEELEGRIGFEGVDAFEGAHAEDEVVRLYRHKRVPEKYRAKGAANPVRFIGPDGSNG